MTEQLYVSNQDAALSLGVTYPVYMHFLRVAGHPDMPVVKVRHTTGWPVQGREIESMVRYLRGRTNITADQEATLRSMARPAIDVAKRGAAGREAGEKSRFRPASPHISGNPLESLHESLRTIVRT